MNTTSRILAVLCTGALALSSATISSAATLLAVDFGQTQTPSLVEAGFSGFKVSNVGVTGPVTQTFGAYTVRIANGITVDGGGFLNAIGIVNARDRGAPATDTGTFTYNDVYRDFVTQGTDTGVQVTGLTANTAYVVTFYTYDNNNSRTQTFKNITGGSSTTLGTLGWTAGTTFGASTPNDVYSISYSVTSDSVGRLTFDIYNAGGTTLLNAMTIDTIAVPEPSAGAALAGIVALGVVARRRGRAR